MAGRQDEAEHSAVELRREYGWEPTPDECVSVEPSSKLVTVLGWFGIDAVRAVFVFVVRRLLHVRCGRCDAVARHWRDYGTYPPMKCKCGHWRRLHRSEGRTSCPLCACQRYEPGYGVERVA